MSPKEKSEWIDKILDSLNKNGVGSVSDIIFGYGRHPRPGESEDNKIRIIENELIQLGLVIVTEEGNTNKTINGYYYFIISPKGIEQLNNKKTTYEIYKDAERDKDLQEQIQKLTAENLKLERRVLKQQSRQFWIGIIATILGAILGAFLQGVFSL
jgi:hypothetical protein